MITQSDFEKNWSFLKERDVYIACSGGVDSIVLVELIAHFCSNVTLLHVNYHLRGSDSNADAALVQEFATQKGLGFESLNIKLNEFLEKNGGNLQEEARKIRYNWFREKITSNKAVLLLGHHFNDQIETFYQHLARKSGVLGMSCMPQQHGKLIRPLLWFSKDEIYKFARASNLNWREDLSNQSNRYTRNKLRNEIIPFLLQEIPDLEASVRILIHTFQETRATLEAKAANHIAEISNTGSFPFSEFDSLEDEVLLIILKIFDFKPSQLSEVKRLRKSQKGKSISSKTNLFVRENDHFARIPVTKNTPVDYRLEIIPVNSLPKQFSKEEIYLDEAKIKGELRLTTWQLGDRIEALGLNGSKLISDVLTDAKIPSHHRKNCLILRDDVHIHWCVGYKIGRNALAEQDSKHILKIRLVSDEN